MLKNAYVLTLCLYLNIKSERLIEQLLLSQIYVYL